MLKYNIWFRNIPMLQGDLNFAWNDFFLRMNLELQ